MTLTSGSGESRPAAADSAGDDRDIAHDVAQDVAQNIAQDVAPEVDLGSLLRQKLRQGRLAVAGGASPRVIAREIVVELVATQLRRPGADAAQPQGRFPVAAGPASSPPDTGSARGFRLRQLLADPRRAAQLEKLIVLLVTAGGEPP